MVLVANYQSDLGVSLGLYPLRSTVDLALALPSDLLSLYSDLSGSFCRLRAVNPRKVQIQLNADEIVEIELPIKPTIPQLKQIKSNLGAVSIVTIGEDLKYTTLKYYL